MNGKKILGFQRTEKGFKLLINKNE